MMDGNGGDNGFDIGDAVFVGGAIGMAHDLMDEEERSPDEVEDNEYYEDPKSKNVKEVQRLDPELYAMVTSVMKEQEKSRLKRIREANLKKEMDAILAEALEFEKEGN